MSGTARESIKGDPLQLIEFSSPGKKDTQTCEQTGSVANSGDVQIWRQPYFPSPPTTAAVAELTLDTPTEGGQHGHIKNRLILGEVERKKKARSLAVLTDSGEIKARLHKTGEPIIKSGDLVRTSLFQPFEGGPVYPQLQHL